jgi:hypothetical protein
MRRLPLLMLVLGLIGDGVWHLILLFALNALCWLGVIELAASLRRRGCYRLK